MSDTIILFRLGGLTLTLFGLLIALSLPLLARMMDARFRGAKALRRASAIGALAWAVPCALICARLYHFLFSFGDYGFLQALCLWTGGYGMPGAILGFALGLKLYATGHGLNGAAVLDASSPAIAAFVLMERFAENFTDQGFGKEIDLPLLQGGLFSMRDVYGAARHAVCRLEMLSALIALLFALYVTAGVLRRPRLRGEAFRPTLLLLAAPQVVWESLRDDAYLAYGFVRVTQVAAMAACLAIAGFYAVRLWRADAGSHAAVLAALAACAGCAAVAVIEEFAVDSSHLREVNYLIMLAAMLLMACCALRMRQALLAKTAKARRRASGQAAARTFAT